MLNLTLTSLPSLWLSDAVKLTYSYRTSFEEVKKAKSDYLASVYRYSPSLKFSFSSSSIDEPSVSQMFNSYPINATTLTPSFEILLPGGGSVSGDLKWENTSSNPVRFPGFPPPSGESYTRKLSFSFNQPLLKGFVFPSADVIALKLSRNAYLLSKEKLEQTSQTLSFSLALSYYSYVADILKVYYNFEKYVSSLESFSKTKENVKLGASDRTELLSARIDLLSKENSLRMAWNSAVDSRDKFLSFFPPGKVNIDSPSSFFGVRIEELTGGDADKLKLLLRELEPRVSALEGFFNETISQVLEFHSTLSSEMEGYRKAVNGIPSVRMAKIAYDNAKLNFSYTRSMALPSLNFFASLSFYGNSDDPDNALSTMLDRNHTSWNLGFMFQMPLIPGKPMSEISSAKAQLNSARLSYEQAQKRALEEFERSLRNFDSSVQAYKNTEELLKLAAELFKRQSERYSSAMIPFKVFISSHDTFVTMKLTRLNSAVALVSAYLDFLRTCGISWR